MVNDLNCQEWWKLVTKVKMEFLSLSRTISFHPFFLTIHSDEQISSVLKLYSLFHDLTTGQPVLLYLYPSRSTMAQNFMVLPFVV